MYRLRLVNGQLPPARQLIGVAVATLVAVAWVAVPVVATRPETAIAHAAPVSAAAGVTDPAGTAPWDQVVETLRLNANAVVDGDEQAWLATVDPAEPELRARYSAIFRELRALGVTSLEYRPGIPVKSRIKPPAFTFPTHVFYCFGPDTCRGDPDVPQFDQKLTMKPVGGHYVITRSVIASDAHVAGPPPWLDGRLVLAEGNRVVLAADPGEATYLPAVLPMAEKAAALNDKFATILNATQTRYRIYLAGEKQWHSWYGGVNDKWAIGVAQPIGQYGVDVIIRIAELHNDPRQLQATLQHELGHVVTLTGATQEVGAGNVWLAEGVAEYIGWSPLPAAKSLRRASVRSVLHSSHRPTSMIPALPGRNASLRAGDAFYGLSHFAVDCLAHRYGQAAMFKFVRQVLTFGENHQDASRYAFGVPFSTVDKGCTSWIRQQAG